MSSTSYISTTDMFCGCGGSSEGAKEAGAEIILAANHWELAIKSHNANHPNTTHVRADISSSDPRRYPRTTLLIASPECTAHSLSRGVKTPQYTKDLFGNTIADPAAERSRATMWDVPRFAEVHRYEAIIVENVVDVRRWVLFDSWLMAMKALGYEHKCVYFNSMFALPTPQSRDRIYIVFWRTGNRAPDLEFRPQAPCRTCGRVVAAKQVWKMRDGAVVTWGKYGERNQYLYQCPDCGGTVQPFYAPALTAIDWSLPTPRIGDRAKPLKPKTVERIRLGLERYKDRYLVLNTQYSHATNNRSVSVDFPWPTQTAQQAFALVAPLIGANRAHGVPRPVDESAQTVDTGNHLFMVNPFTAVLHGTSTVQGVEEALATVTAGGGHHGLTIPPSFLTRHYERRGAQDGLSRGLDGPLGSITTADHHSLTVVPPALLASYYGQDAGHGLDDPVPTVPTVDRHALVRMPFIVGQYGDSKEGYARNPLRPVDEMLPTIPGMLVHRLAQPGPTPDVEDCGFRMLEPHEIKRAMAFRDDYIVYGNKREQIKQLGNAVTGPVMRQIVERVLATLAG